MSLGDDLLDAIVAAPDDPAARLVYADHRLGFSANDPHAELIVVQERLAELEATGLWRDWFSAEAASLRGREKSLVAAVRLALDVRNLDAIWKRGFVDTLASNDPYHRRRAFHDWLETAEPRSPIAALGFDPLLRVANEVMPQVDLTMVSHEVDRLRGA